MQANSNVEGNRRVRIGTQAAAQHLGVTMRELKELRLQRRIAFYRIGHRTVTFLVADLDAFLDTCRVAPAGEAIGIWRKGSRGA